MKIQKIGRYKIVAVLGKGAMGVVYKGFDEIIQRNVAIKMIYLDKAKAMDSKQLEQSRRRFYRESQAAGKLSHSNIVTIYDISEHRGKPFIAMEYVDGESLLAEIKKIKGGLPWKSMIDIFVQVADGLEYAHSQGVIHRDIKPANIMISSNNQAKIADFGIAKISRSNITQTGIILGTPSYMSPEQIKDCKIDKRSDIFSLGATLYEALTGAKPFTGSDISEIMGRILHFDPPVLKSSTQTFPPAVEQVIKNALMKNPEQRYQSCSQFAADLKMIKRQPSTEKHKVRINALLPTEIVANAKETSQAKKKLESAIKEWRKGLSDSSFVDRISLLLKSSEWKHLKAKLVAIKKSRWFLLAAIGFVLLVTGISIFFIIRGRQTAYQKRITESVSSKEFNVEIIDLSQLTEKPKAKPGKKNIKPTKKNIKMVPIDTSSQKRDKSLKKEIFVTSYPNGASIFIDGEDSGLLTPSIIQFEAIKGSKHTIAIMKDCYDKVSKQLWIRDEEKATITLKLNPSTNIVKIESKPSKAKIVIDGKDTGEFTPAGLRVACGQSYKLALVKDGFNTFTTTLKPEMSDKSLTYDLKRQQLAWELYINSNPSGASIFQNNVEINRKTPTSLQLRGYKGEDIIITLKKKGYQPASRTVRLRDVFKTDIQLNLSPIVRTVVINSNPSGAEVVVNSRKISKTTPVKLELVGDRSYAVKLSKSGFYPKEITVNALIKEKSVDVNLSKMPQPGQAVIISTYAVDIYVKGKLVASSDKRNSIELPPGNYQIQLINKELFLNRSYPITIKSGIRVSINTPPLGRISIKPEPSRCKIYINGFLLGYPPIIEQPIVVGEHIVKFEWEKFNEIKEAKVKVRQGKVAYLYKQRGK